MSITRLTQRYIIEHPSVKECLQRGFINYSALAREICKVYKTNQFDAVLAACRRFANRKKTTPQQEKKILALMKSAELRVSSKVAVAIVDQQRDLERLHNLQREIRKLRGEFNLIDSDTVHTLIFSQQYLERVRNSVKGSFKKLTTDCAQLTLVFDERVETTAGVVSYVYGLLAYHGINMLEEISCWTDLIIIIDEHDVARAMAALSQE